MTFRRGQGARRGFQAGNEHNISLGNLNRADDQKILDIAKKTQGAAVRKEEILNSASDVPFSDEENAAINAIDKRREQFDKNEAALAAQFAEPEIADKSVDDTKNEEKGRFEIAIQPNKLDNFDQVTYEFNLFMVRQADTFSGTVFNKERRFIIAHSGGTTPSFGIDNVIVSTVNAPTSQSRTSAIMTSVEFTISEYGGVSLIDKIYYASLELGISNYYKSPYYLELRFKGRDPDSSSPDLDPETISKTYLWPIYINRIETEITSGGAEYKFESVPYDQMAQMNYSGAIDKTLTFSSGTVLDAINKIKETLDARQVERYPSSQSKRDTFIFEVDPAIGKMKLYDPANVSKSGEATAGASKEGAADNTKKEIQIAAGTSIFVALEQVISSSPEYQKFMSNSTSPTSNTQDKGSGTTMKRIHRVYTKSRAMEYDNRRGDYAREYTYFINMYEMGTLITGGEEKTGTEKVTEYINKKYLQKEYNYIFTGNNTQILNFELKFNFGWFVNVPRGAGLYTDYTQNIDGYESKLFPENYRTKVELRKRIGELFANIGNADFSSSSQEISNQIENADNLTDADREDLNNLLNRVRTERLTNISTGTPEGARISSIAALNAADAAITGSGSKRPITLQEFDPDVNINTSVEQAHTSGKQYVNSLLTQAFAAKNGDQTKIEVEIKGDPYWLSPAPWEGNPNANTSILDRSTNNSNARNPNEKVSTGANALQAQQFILFTLRTPEQPNEDTGVISAQSNTSVYNGVYAVNKVKHTFTKGKFTQVLSCIVEPLISYEDILDFKGTGNKDITKTKKGTK